MKKSSTVFVGMDVHKESIDITLAEVGGEVHRYGHLELAERFHTVIVSGVPRVRLELVDEGRRFTLMVDVFYDNRVKLILSAETTLEQLLKREEANDARIRAMMLEFDRTASRLAEMQTRHYLEQPRRAAA